MTALRSKGRCVFGLHKKFQGSKGYIAERPCLKKREGGRAVEMAQQLSALAALPEDEGLVPNTQPSVTPQ